MSCRFDRTNFVSGTETLFGFITYILKNNCEDKSFGNCVVSEVCIFFLSALKLY